jgi:hypothetical protein
MSNLQKRYVFLIIGLCLLFNQIGEEGRQVLPGSKGGEGKREGVGEWVGGSGGEMAQTMYAYMNK